MPVGVLAGNVVATGDVDAAGEEDAADEAGVPVGPVVAPPWPHPAASAGARASPDSKAAGHANRWNRIPGVCHG